jgi:Flp pilus assembly protein TadD
VVLAYVEGTDTVGHLFAAYRPPALPGSDPGMARRLGPVVDRYHGFIDAWLGRIVASLGPKDTIVILSDHGFTWDDRPSVPSGAHTPTAVYWHRPDAVFIAAGPKVRPDASRRRIDPLDVAPVLLALANLPAGVGLPGSVPVGLLVEALPTGVPPVRYGALIPRWNPGAQQVPDAMREETLAKLRTLGYIGGTAPSTPQRGGEVPAPGPNPEPTADIPHLEARKLHNLALGLADRGDLAAAEATFRQAIAADASYPPPHHALARVLRLVGRLDEADRELWAAIELGVSDPGEALTRVAGEYRQVGLANRAGAVLAEASKRYPTDPRIWLDLGTLAGEQGDLTLARQCLERTVALAPADPIAQRNLGVACLGLGDREGARRALTEALRLNPGDAEVKRQLEQLGAPPR